MTRRTPAIETPSQTATARAADLPPRLQRGAGRGILLGRPAPRHSRPIASPMSGRSSRSTETKASPPGPTTSPSGRPSPGWSRTPRRGGSTWSWSTSSTASPATSWSPWKPSRRLEAAGVGFVSISESMSFTDPIGKVVLATLGAFATIRRVEQEVMEPRMGTTRKLAAALGVNESWLAYGVGEAPENEERSMTRKPASTPARQPLLGPPSTTASPARSRSRATPSTPSSAPRRPTAPRTAGTVVEEYRDEGKSRLDRRPGQAPRLRPDDRGRRGRPVRRGGGPQARPLLPQPDGHPGDAAPPGGRRRRLRLDLGVDGLHHPDRQGDARQPGRLRRVLLRQPLRRDQEGQGRTQEAGPLQRPPALRHDQGRRRHPRPRHPPALVRHGHQDRGSATGPGQFELAAAGQTDREIARR